METFVRFETPNYCRDSLQPAGVFWAVADVEEREDLDRWTRDWLAERSAWFGKHLPVPRRHQINERAIFWFRPRAKCIRDIWSLIAILREEGLTVSLRRTTRPGRIIYTDDHQIAAIPWRRGRRRA
jgi:hypothetical protein